MLPCHCMVSHSSPLYRQVAGAQGRRPHYESWPYTVPSVTGETDSHAERCVTVLLSLGIVLELRICRAYAKTTSWLKNIDVLSYYQHKIEQVFLHKWLNRHKCTIKDAHQRALSMCIDFIRENNVGQKIVFISHEKYRFFSYEVVFTYARCILSPAWLW